MRFDVAHNHEITNHSTQSGFNMDSESLKREHSFSNQVVSQEEMDNWRSLAGINSFDVCGILGSLSLARRIP